MSPSHCNVFSLFEQPRLNIKYLITKKYFEDDCFVVTCTEHLNDFNTSREMANSLIN